MPRKSPRARSRLPWPSPQVRGRATSTLSTRFLSMSMTSTPNPAAWKWSATTGMRPRTCMMKPPKVLNAFSASPGRSSSIANTDLSRSMGTPAVDQPGPVLPHDDILLLGRFARWEVADDGCQHVGQRDQPLQLAVLVHDQRQLRPGATGILEQRGGGGTLRYIERRSQEALDFQDLPGQRRLEQIGGTEDAGNVPHPQPRRYCACRAVNVSAGDGRPGNAGARGPGLRGRGDGCAVPCRPRRRRADAGDERRASAGVRARRAGGDAGARAAL